MSRTRGADRRWFGGARPRTGSTGAGLTSAAHTLPYDLTLLADESALTTRASALRVPTLVAGGSRSPAPLQEAVARVARSLPGASVRSVEGQSHNLGAGPAARLMCDFFLGGVETADPRATEG